MRKQNMMTPCQCSAGLLAHAKICSVGINQQTTRIRHSYVAIPQSDGCFFGSLVFAQQTAPQKVWNSSPARAPTCAGARLHEDAQQAAMQRAPHDRRRLPPHALQALHHQRAGALYVRLLFKRPPGIPACPSLLLESFVAGKWVLPAIQPTNNSVLLSSRCSTQRMPHDLPTIHTVQPIPELSFLHQSPCTWAKRHGRARAMLTSAGLDGAEQ